MEKSKYPLPLVDLPTALALSACNKATHLHSGDNRLFIVERHWILMQRLAPFEQSILVPTSEYEDTDYRYTLQIVHNAESTRPRAASMHYASLAKDEFREVLASYHLSEMAALWSPVSPLSW